MYLTFHCHYLILTTVVCQIKITLEGTKMKKERLGCDLPYGEEMAKLKHMIQYGVEGLRKRNMQQRRSKACILLIQLFNASRISEAMEAYGDFQKYGERVLKVRIRKRGYEYTRKTKDGAVRRKNPVGSPPEAPCYREMTIPNCVPKGLPKIVTSRANMTLWCKKWMEHNTHSYRYSAITHMARTGVNPLIIKEITGHATLQMVSEYCDESAARDVMRARLALLEDDPRD